MFESLLLFNQKVLYACLDGVSWEACLMPGVSHARDPHQKPKGMH